MTMSESAGGGRPSMAGMRSPFVSLNDMFNLVHEKGLKNGFYNSIALIFLLFVVLIIYMCFCILQPFLRPLVWAILCGSALHPFKHQLMSCSHKWISDLKTANMPITVGTVWLPFCIANSITDSMIYLVKKYKKLFIFIALTMCLHYCFVDIMDNIYELLYKLLLNTIELLSAVLSVWTHSDYTSYITLMTIIYFTPVLSFGWSQSTQSYLMWFSPFVLLLFFVHIICLFGTYGHIISLMMVSIVLIGLLKEAMTGHTNLQTSDQTDGFVGFSIKIKNIMLLIVEYSKSLIGNQDQLQSDDGDDTDEDNNEEKADNTEQSRFASVATSPMPPDAQPLNCDTVLYSRRISCISSQVNNDCQSNTYLCAVLWAVVIVQMWSHSSLIYLLFIPLVIKIVTNIWRYISSVLINKLYEYIEYFHNQNKTLFNPTFKYIYKYFISGDRLLLDFIEKSLNGLTSLSVISLTIISILFIGIFMSIQIYGESLHLVNLMSNVVNKTLSYYPESSQLLPESLKGVNGMLDQMVKNGYEYGRQYIKNSVRNALNVDTNVTQSKAVEKQVLEIWDRAYHLWLIRNSNETDLLPKKGPYDFDKLYNALQTLDLNLVVNIVKENIDTFISVFDSVWLLLKGNISLLFSAIAAVFSTLLGGGLGLMNLVFNFIIFMTALFYLLSASGEHYKPVEFVNQIFPSEVSPHQTNVSTNSKLGRAVEEAINGVFTATIKMSAFYGLYTWLIHTFFEANIVYIPSVMAAIFGAIPFLSAFWASFPTFLDLFFVQNQTTKAILLLIAAYFPAFIVDSTIYSEIKSAGHPYLTGLAIAGGLFYLGFEGAFFGPLLLCCLFVAFNIYKDIMQENVSAMSPERTPQTPQIPVNLRIQRLKSLN